MPSRNDPDIHATGPTTTCSLAAVPADVAILSGFVNNTSGTASSVAGAEIQDANFDGVGGTANQVFANSTPTAVGDRDAYLYQPECCRFVCGGSNA